MTTAPTSRPADLGPRLEEKDENGQSHDVPPAQQGDYVAGLLSQVRQSPPAEEIFALIKTYPGGGPGHSIEVVISRGGTAELRWLKETRDGPPPTDRYFARPLTDAELADLRAFVADHHIDELPRPPIGAWDGVVYEYLHVRPSSARRLVINNPREDEIPYIELVHFFDELADPEKLSLRYPLHRLPDGAEILFARPDQEIRDVWARGTDVRVLVGKYEMTGEDWHALMDRTLGDTVEPPPGSDAQPMQLEKTLPDGSRMDYAVSTPDRDWVVGTVSGTLQRYNRSDHRLLPIVAPNIAEHYQALEFAPAHGKVLIVRRPTTPWGQAADPTEYALLEPSSGDVTKMSIGDAQPFNQRHARIFQPTGQADVVWFAFESPPLGSYIGRYDMRSFRFRRWFIVPSLLFSSDQMWVDESTARVYAVVDGHLFRFPLPKDVYEDWKQ